MTGINHAVGGVVFTGIFASFWNVNIFASANYITLTLFASLLPDIDHTRSIIGKMFYPIAKYLDRNFRHRTITHSILFITVLCLISGFIESIFSDEFNFTLILFFGVFSHFIFDMVTIQGIPLFYPFYRNPCVIFGNPSFRLKTGNRQSEMVVLALFILIGVSCADLFKNGFWTTYNRSFGTLKHLSIEHRNSDTFLQVEYSYTRNTKTYAGTGLCIDAKDNKAILFDSTIVVLEKANEAMRINYVRPTHTDKQKIVNESVFFSISLDSLQNFVKGKIISGNIQSSMPVQIFEKNIRRVTNNLKLEYSFNPELTLVADTAKESIRKQLTLKKERLAQNKAERRQEETKLTNYNNRYYYLKAKSKKETRSYEKNNIQNEMIELDHKIKQQQIRLKEYIPNQVLRKEIELLEQELKEDHILFSGYVNWIGV